MKIIVFAFSIVVAFVLGVNSGYAQRSEPDFVLEISAPMGETQVSCISGCSLIGMRDIEIPNAGKMKNYVFSCSGGADQPCQAQVAGWQEH